MSERQINIESQLSAYIDGLLDAEQREFIEQYLDRYPEHRQLIDQLKKERALLRDLPRESAPPDVLAHFQEQLERSVLLEDFSNGGIPRRTQRGRWNLAVLLTLLMVAGAISVIVWIAMPPKRVRQVIEPVIPEEEIAATTQAATTREATTEPATAPVAMAPANYAHASLIDVQNSNSSIVMIWSPDLPATKARVGAFLKSESLAPPAADLDQAASATQPSESSDQAWDVPGMTRAQARALVNSFSLIPTTLSSTEPIIAPATHPAATMPATTNPATTMPTLFPIPHVMIMFQREDSFTAETATSKPKKK